MRVEHISDDVVVYLGDCVEILPTLGKFDHVITDPPYETHMHNSRGKSEILTTRKVSSEISFDSVERVRPLITPLIVDSTKGWSLIFCTAEGVAAWRDAIESVGARYKRAMPWVKTDAVPQFNGQGPAHCLEMIVSAWCGRGYSKWNGGGSSGKFIGSKSIEDRTHETEKPIWLMSELVSLFTNPDDHVLDCFMGSGTTGVACINLGRKFTGIEMNEKYFDISCRRLEAATRQENIFSKKKIAQEKIL